MAIIDKRGMPYLSQSQGMNFQQTGRSGQGAGKGTFANILPGLIGVAGSIGSSLISSSTQRRNVKEQNKARREEAERAHQRDIEMWERQNEYNSPEAQQERFREAGLNPHLMYGQGTPGNAQTMPQYNPANMEFKNIPAVDPLGAVEGYLQTSQKQQNVRLTKQQVEVQTIRESLEFARTAKVWNENDVISLEATIARTLMDKHAGELDKIALGRIGGMKAQDWLKVATAQIKQWEKGLTDQNINPRDSVQMRMLIDLLETIGFSPQDIKRNLK